MVTDTRQTIVHINGGKVKALAIGVEGKQTTLKLLGKGKLPDDVKKVCVIGREDPTNAELARDRFVLGVLQGVEVMDHIIPVGYLVVTIQPGPIIPWTCQPAGPGPKSPK